MTQAYLFIITYCVCNLVPLLMHKYESWVPGLWYLIWLHKVISSSFIYYFYIAGSCCFCSAKFHWELHPRYFSTLFGWDCEQTSCTPSGICLPLIFIGKNVWEYFNNIFLVTEDHISFSLIIHLDFVLRKWNFVILFCLLFWSPFTGGSAFTLSIFYSSLNFG